MSLPKASLIVVAVYVAVISLSFQGHIGIANTPGYSSEQSRVACGKCGDGVCVRQCGENEKTCPADCQVTTSKAAACGKCGDGVCVRQCGENEKTCPADCASTSTVAQASMTLSRAR